MTLADFHAKVDALHQEFQFSETSGWRTVKRNKAVGGDKNSKHLRGLAVDCVLDSAKDAPAFKKRVKAKGLVWLDEGDHIHVQVPKGT